MSRQMRSVDSGSIVTVHGWAMTRNMWEYFLLDSKPDTVGNIFALVMGDETEMGDVNLPELKPYVCSFTRDLDELSPAIGWEWVR